MGRHSAPTALTRAAKRATIATSAAAVGASLLATGTGTAQASSATSAVKEVEKAGATFVTVVTQGTAAAIDGGEKVTSTVIGYWNDLPVVATLVRVSTEKGVEIPVLGTIKLASSDLAAGISYNGLPGVFGATAGVDSSAAPYLVIQSPYAAGTVTPLSLEGDLLKLVTGKGSAVLPEIAFTNGGVSLTGPTLTVKDGSILNKAFGADFKLATGSIGISASGLSYDGPKLTGSSTDNATASGSALGKVTGGFDTGHGTIGKDTKIEAPAGSIDATSAPKSPIDSTIGGPVSVGGSVDGGTWTPSGVTDASVSVRESAPGAANTTTVEGNATTTGADADLTNTLTTGSGKDATTEVTGATASTDDGISIK